MGPLFTRYAEDAQGITIYVLPKINADTWAGVKSLCKYYASTSRVTLRPKQGECRLQRN